MDIDYKVGEVELVYKATTSNRHKIKMSCDAYNLLLPTFKEGTIDYKEYFKVIYLNQAYQVLGYTQISEGGLTDINVDIRVILQAALLINAPVLILAHNHPSGSTKPSELDLKLTKQIKKAAKLMRITVVDHIILTNEGYYSFKDEGIL